MYINEPLNAGFGVWDRDRENVSNFFRIDFLRMTEICSILLFVMDVT